MTPLGENNRRQNIMNNSNTRHETILINRTIKALPSLIFNAWVSPKARLIWGVPSDDEAMAFIETDFRVGGKDVHICGPKENLCYRVETCYHDIQEPRLLVFTERVSNNSHTLCSSLITVDLTAEGKDTNLDLTIQIASLVGDEMISGNREGWRMALTNMELMLVKMP